MEYEFRVIAVNAAGESDPSRASKSFLAQDPVDAPGQVSDLELIDSTNSSLTFQWKGTDVHGGAEFLGYDIELQKVKGVLFFTSLLACRFCFNCNLR